MQPYAHAPRMGAGTAGKHGLLRLGFERDGERTIMLGWERHAPLIVQQALYFDAEWAELPCVYILSSGGPNVDGDRYEQYFSVGPDAFAHIATGAATKIASMRYNYASLYQRIELAQGAYLEYLPEPIIPCRGSRYCSQTHIVIAASATLLYAETYLCGRRWSGERFDYDILSVAMRAERDDGELLFTDKFIIRPHDECPSVEGVMGSFEVLSQVVVITPQHVAEQIYRECEPVARPDFMASATMLPNGAGVIYRIMGMHSQQVKREVRKFCSLVRMTVKGRTLADDFPWR